MITKERLEELIEQGVSICNQYIDYNNNIYYRFGKASIIQDNDKPHIELKLNGTDTSVIMYDTKYLFETEEDAEFALRFKRIPKTEYLDLPTWEEFMQSDKQVIIYDKDKTYYLDKVMNKTHIIIGYKCIIDLNEELEAARYNFYRKPATKENYLEACEICRKLWLGEEV